jgi:hypothetical protein
MAPQADALLVLSSRDPPNRWQARLSRQGSNRWAESTICLGASLTIIDRNCLHLACGRCEHTLPLLDELSAEQRPRWTLVDAAWTSMNDATARGDNRNIS